MKHRIATRWCPRLRHLLVFGVVFWCTAPLAAGGLKADLEKTASGQRKLIISLVEAMPEASFESRPTDQQRTFREAALHVAGANSFLSGFTGAQTPGPKVAVAKFQTDFGLEAVTKTDVLAALNAGFDHMEAAIQEFDEQEMLEEVQGPPWVGKVPRASMFYYLLSHNHNIYGQMVVYLRLAGGTPPASGG